MNAVEQIAGLLDKQADLMLCIAEAVGRLEPRQSQWPVKFADLYNRVGTLSNHIASVAQHCTETREMVVEIARQVAEHIEAGEAESP